MNLEVSRTRKARRSSISRMQLGGYVLMEIVIALGLFAAVAVSLVKALHMTGDTASTIQDQMRVERVLRSALTDVLSRPNLEEGEEKFTLAEMMEIREEFNFPGEIEVLIEPLELENEDGQLLQNMFRIVVTFFWRGADGEWQERSAETWRYGNLYRP